MALPSSYSFFEGATGGVSYSERASMTPNQPQAAPPLVPVGGEIILGGYRFEVVAHTTDKDGKAVELPGRALGRAPKAPKQNKLAGQAVVVPALPVTHALTPSQPKSTPRPRKARAPRRTPAQRWVQQHQPKPPPLVVVNEPWGAGQWFGLLAVLTLIVAAIWLSNQGSEAKKWESIEATARAIRGR